MAAASYSSDVLQESYEPRQDEIITRDGFQITQNNFQGWLRVWRMDVSETNPNRGDIFRFARENKETFTDLIEEEISELKNVKVGFGLEVKFSIERDGETQTMKHYFKNNRPYIFNRYDKEQIKEKFDEFIENIRGEIEVWSGSGSGWVVEKINLAYVNIAKYEPLRGGTYLPLPANLAKKEGHNQRAKPRQQIPEVGSKSCFISSKRWKEPTKTKQISGQRRYKLQRHRFSNTSGTNRQT